MAHEHHRHHRRHHQSYDGRKSDRAGLLRWGGLAVLLLAAMLLGIILLSDVIEPEAPVVQIDPGTSSQPTLTIQHDGRTWEHKEYQFTTILFIGVDQPELTGASLRAGGQADFLILMAIDRVDHQVHILQIDRDAVVPVQVYGAFGNPAGVREMQICLSYAFGTTTEKACLNTVRAVETLLGGIPIDHYVALDMEGMALLNDALGGVTVTLTEDFSMFDPVMIKGATITLRGKQAEYFLRGRMSVGDGTNAARMSRQAVFMEAAATLATSRMATDPGYLVTVVNALEGHLVSSCDMAWLINQAYAVRLYPRTKNVGLQGEHLVGADGFVEIHPDTNGLMTYITSTFCE